MPSLSRAVLRISTIHLDGDRKLNARSIQLFYRNGNHEYGTVQGGISGIDQIPYLPCVPDSATLTSRAVSLYLRPLPEIFDCHENELACGCKYVHETICTIPRVPYLPHSHPYSYMTTLTTKTRTREPVRIFHGDFDDPTTFGSRDSVSVVPA